VQVTLIWAHLKDKSLSLLVCCVKQITSPPTDGVSSLSFSPKANYLVATSWDNQVMHLACMQYVLLTPIFWSFLLYFCIACKLWISMVSHARSRLVICFSYGE
jgi:WD40 repeat protein